MSVLVFNGPTLAPADCQRFPEFEFRQPVQQGDVFAATRENPSVIGIVDGYFDGHPAVWHKEILWALSKGIAVFGASSMGALRAAELHTFGMRGVGWIFEGFRDGALTDDDEVALIHGPAETSYLKLSEPMVNIRATLQRAVREGSVDQPTADRLMAGAKARFYQDRSWADVLEQFNPGDPAREPFETWLKTGKVDQKRTDALSMLEAIQAFCRHPSLSEPPGFAFEWTESWNNAPWRTAAQSGGEELSKADEAMLDEMRLDGSYRRLRRDALLRLLAREALAAQDTEPGRRAITRETKSFRMGRGLFRQNDLIGWCEENGMSAAGFERMMVDRTAVERLARMRDIELRREILDRARETDAYVKLRNRASTKQETASTSLTRVPHAVLLSWYFDKRMGVPVPDNLTDYVSTLGIDEVDRFYDLLAAEYAFVAAETVWNVTGAKTKTPIV